MAARCDQPCTTAAHRSYELLVRNTSSSESAKVLMLKMPLLLSTT